MKRGSGKSLYKGDYLRYSFATYYRIDLIEKGDAGRFKNINLGL
jgi:hypothetical protein